MELIAISRDLMPEGKPAFLQVVKFPMIRDLAKSEGPNIMLKVLLLMVKDFCNSLNVVRNMNDDQMIEAASMLLDECDNFRLEDYTMMFSLGKRGQLVKIMDRIDLQIITAMMDEYWIQRKRAATKTVDEEIKHLDSIGNTARLIDTMNPIDAKMNKAADGVTSAIEALRVGMIDNDLNVKQHGEA